MQLFVDNLTNVDFSYLHPSRGVVGETWLASVILEGELDEQGMICDFGIVKKMLRQWLDQTIDHCLLVASQAKALKSKDESPETIAIEWSLDDKQAIWCNSPSSAITFITDTDITPESVAKWCIEQLRPKFPSSVKKLELNFVTESISTPYYHYSHGLKKHDGNCQRIAHGHRSKIEIWKDGKINAEAMQHWAEAWKDIYIGSKEDLVETKNADNYAFAYEAQQGAFELELPKSNCYLIDTDSTVELIAQHIANELKAAEPDSKHTVKAYEGLAKGAIVNA